MNALNHRDVTHEPDVRRWVKRAFKTEKYLFKHGFEELGFVTLQGEPGACPYVKPEDQAEWDRFWSGEYATVVYVSSDRRVVVDAELAHGVEWFRARTILSDGTIVMTRRTPEYEPPTDLQEGTGPFDTDDDRRRHQAFEHFWAKLTGEGVDWTVRGQANSGLFIDALPPKTRPRDILDAHNKAIDSVCEARGTHVAPVDDMAMYLQLTERTWLVRRSLRERGETIGSALVATLWIPGMVGWGLTCWWVGWSWWLPPVGLIGGALWFTLLVILGLRATNLWGPWLARLVPVSRPTSVEEETVQIAMSHSAKSAKAQGLDNKG